MHVVVTWPFIANLSDAAKAVTELRRPHRWRPVTDKRVGQSLHEVHVARNWGVRAPSWVGDGRTELNYTAERGKACALPFREQNVTRCGVTVRAHCRSNLSHTRLRDKRA